jgi:hypothetical protein
MESLRPILDALRTASRRDRRSLWSFSTNNLFLATLLLGIAGLFFWCLMALALLFPLMSDPLQKIPEERLKLWPLTNRQRMALHWRTPWLNPMTWVFALVALWGVVHGMPLFALVVLLIPLAGILRSSIPTGISRTLWRVVPPFPGVFGSLIRKDLREILSTLDFWAALSLSASCLFYRVFVGQLPGDALMMCSIFVVLALSSWSESCFGLDGREGMVRYHLLPVAGWQIFAAKGAAFLLVVTVLALPLSLPAAWAAAGAALAVGNVASLDLVPQKRWRFFRSNISYSVAQILLLAAAGGAAYRISAIVLLPSFLLCLVSTYWCGRRLFG